MDLPYREISNISDQLTGFHCSIGYRMNEMELAVLVLFILAVAFVLSYLIYKFN